MKIIPVTVLGGKAGKILFMLLDLDHELYVSEYMDYELKEKLEQK